MNERRQWEKVIRRRREKNYRGLRKELKNGQRQGQEEILDTI
jgi:hypothetical protein